VITEEIKTIRPRDNILSTGDKLSIAKQLKVIYNVLTTYKLVQLFILYSTTIMWQSLDLSAISCRGGTRKPARFYPTLSGTDDIITGLAISIIGTIYALLSIFHT